MTNEERHIAVLNRMLENMDVYDSIQPTTERKKAIKAAIKALEQEPCDNAVSRQDVLDLAKKGILVSNGNYESVCKAINELPSVNPQPCEDAIDRAEAMTEIMMFAGNVKPDEEDIYIKVSDAVQLLRDLPPVNPTKTGHWIEHPEIETSTPEYLMFYECSECGDRQCFCKSDIHKKRFCGNCGCRMVEPQESE